MIRTSRPSILSRRISAAIAAITVTGIVTTLYPSDANAATKYWDNNGSTANTGTTAVGVWGTSSFWGGSNGDVATTGWTSNDIAVFASGTNFTGTYTVDVSGTQTAGGITFEEGTVTLGNASGGTISLINNSSITANTGRTANISANLTTAANWVKAGAGSLVLSGANTYGGTTTINDGYVTFSNTGAAPSAAGSITLSSSGVNSGSLVASGAQTAVTGWLTSGKINTASTGSIAVAGDSSENIDFTGFNSLGLATSAAAAIYSGSITPGLNGYIFGGASGSNLTVSSVLSGINALIKNGTGTVTLTGANDYTGTTTINGGALNVANASALGSGTISFKGGALQYSAATASTDFSNRFSTSTGQSYSIDTNGQNVVTFGASLMGAGNTFTKNGAGSFSLSQSNTYTGRTTVNGGTLTINGNQSLATGGFTVASGAILNFASGSTINVTSNGINTGNGFVNWSLNVAGTITNSVGLSVTGSNDNASNGVILNAGADWTQSGTLTVQPNTTSSTALFTVNSGASFKYTNTTSDIVLSNSTGGLGGSSRLTIAGGTFETGRGFASNGGGANTGNASLVISGGGTLKVTNDVANLAQKGTSGSTNTNPFTFQLGTGGGIIDVASGKSAALALNITNVTSQTGSLTKGGDGTLTLSGINNAYSGATTVSGGRLVVSGALTGTSSLSVSGGSQFELGADNVLNNAAQLNLTGGNFSTNGFDDVASTLMLGVGVSTINFGSGSSILTLAESSALAWTGTLSIFNWSGDMAGGGLDQLFFGASSTGLTPEQVAAIQFVDPAGLPSGTYGAQMLNTGELVAVPEPSSIAILAGGLGCLLGVRRRSSVQST